MKLDQFKLMSEIMEKIDSQSRLPVPRTMAMPTVDAEVISLIQKTYQEQNMPVTVEQINKAVEEVKKNYEPIQGLDYLLQFRQQSKRWSSKKFKKLSRINPGVVVVEPGHKSSTEVIKYMLNYGLDVRPYSSSDRLQYLSDLLLTMRLSPVTLFSSGLAFMGAAMLLKKVAFFGSPFLIGGCVIASLILFVLSPWAFFNRIDIKMLRKQLEKKVAGAAEGFHEEFAFNFHKDIRHSQPSPAAMNAFFEGIYIPSAPLVWNDQSREVLKKASLNKSIHKIIRLWSEEGVAWRQQDFWFFVVLGCHMEALPSHQWLSTKY